MDKFGNNQGNQQDWSFERTLDERLIKGSQKNSLQKTNTPNGIKIHTHTGGSPFSSQNTALSSVLPDGTQPLPLGSGVIDGLLGEGGMARVYRIWNSKLEMYRAVKVLLPTERSELMERFETEIKISAKLHHPNIIETYTVGEWNALPFIEMELVEGVTLDCLIQQHGKIPVEISTAVGIQVARALEYAHSQEVMLYGKVYNGIVHRDLKPSNIMISKSGVVKLMDFGIARPTEVSLHTIAGNIVGTLPYLSPEQLDDKDIDKRSDLYSFGTILYEALTGEKTFPQTTVTNLMRMKAINSYRKFDTISIAIPDSLAKSVEKCLKQEKTDRFGSADEMEIILSKIFNRMTSDSPETILKRYLSDPVAFKSKFKEGTFRFPFQPKTVFIVGAIIIALALITSLLLSIFPFVSGKKDNEQTAEPVQIDTAKIEATTNLPHETATPPDTVKSGYNQMIVPIESKPVVKQAATPHTIHIISKKPADNKKSPVAPISQASKVVANATNDYSQKYETSDYEKKYGTNDWASIGEAAYKAGQFSDVIVAFENVRSDYPLKEKQAIILAFAYLETNQISNAAAIAKMIHSDDAFFIMINGRLAQSEKNYKLALENYERAITRPSDFKSSIAIRGDALYNTALVYDDIYTENRSPAAKQQVLIAWNNLKYFYISQPKHPWFKLANQKMVSY